MQPIYKVLTLALLCFACASLSQAADKTFDKTLRAPANVRAVWVRPFNDADENTRRSSDTGRAYIRRELERLKRAGMNTVYVESFFDGYAMYPSKFVPMRPLNIKYGVATKENQGWDVLQVYIEEGGRLGLSVQAWFEVFFIWHTGLGTVDKSPIFSKHPDWLMLDETGSPLVHSEAEGANKEIDKVFMSPSHREVRKFLIQLVSEIAVNYPKLDGLQLDYIRYPLHTKGAAFDYSKNTLEQFKAATELDARKLSPERTPRQWQQWQDWKTGQVTEAVREMTGAIRRLRPQMIISAAVFPGFEENLRVKMQDVRAWSREGLIDALLPMLYSTNFKRVDDWAKEFRAEIDKRRTRVYPALYVNHFYDVKAKRIDERYLQLEQAHGFDGTGFFAAQLLTDDVIEKLPK